MTTSFTLSRLLQSVAVLFFVCGMWVPKWGAAQDLDTTMWVTNGIVRAIAQSGNTVYIGGKFSYVGPNTGPSVLIDEISEKMDESFPRVEGIVQSSTPDGKGGWFIAGVFNRVGNYARNNIAHINADNSLDQAWSPDIQLSQYESSIGKLVVAGNRLYLAGNRIERINGQNTGNFAAISISTGEVVINLPKIYSSISALAIKDDIAYIGGCGMLYAGEIKRDGLAAINITTGSITDWNPEVVCGMYGGISSIIVDEDILYIAGNFVSIKGEGRMGIAAIDIQTGLPTPWISNGNGQITSLLKSGSYLYAIGSFQFNNQSYLATRIDPKTGERQLIGPIIDSSKSHYGAYSGTASAFIVHKEKMYITGDFYDPKSNLCSVAVIDLANGNTLPSSLKVGGTGFTINASDDKIFIGGRFSSFGGAFRSNAAAFNIQTGQVTSWAPEPNGNVYSLATYGSKVYINGTYNMHESYSWIGGKVRSGLVEVDNQTGKATDWDPLDQQKNPDNNSVYSMVVHNNTLFLQGSFDKSSTNKKLISVDLPTGKRTNWQPLIPESITAMIAYNNVVYVATGAYKLGPHQLFAIDAQSGNLTGWQSKSVEGSIDAMCVFNNTLFVGGLMWKIDNQSRSGLAAINLTSGNLNSWNPTRDGDDGEIYTLAASRNILYVGGMFVKMAGKQRLSLASYNMNTGQITDWYPNSDYSLSKYINLILPVGGKIYVGDGDMDAKYLTTYTGIRGITAFTEKSYSTANKITGRIYQDENADCKGAATEEGLSDVIIKVEPGDFFAVSDGQGNFTIEVPKGSFVINQIPPKYSGLISRLTCPPTNSYSVTFDSISQVKAGFDFGNQVTKKPFLKVEVAADRRRRCFSSTTTIHYRNEGFAPASNVQIQVTYPQYVIPISASTAWSSRRDSVLTFDLGTLQAGQSGRITLTDSVICGNEAIRGLTQCVKATITPKNNVKTPDPKWDKSDVELRAVCKDNGFVRLILLNSGVGAMADSVSYRIYLDAVQVFESKYKLSSKDSLHLEVPANGRTVRLEADLRPFHPDGNRQPSITLEGCGRTGVVTISKGFVNQLPQDDALEEVAISCLPILDSYDPNDKQASPVGVGPQHLITEKDELEYLIRFQNTGTDVAYNVVVTDTLDGHLDIATLQIGAASHPFTWQLSGQGRPVITWTFSNINLPDSTHNEAQSHGYLRFRIGQQKDNPLGTTIANQAAITFDFNSPILTNLTTHTIGEIPQQLSSTTVDVCKGNYPTQANAGETQVLKDNSMADLAANVPVKGYGRWRLISGKGTVDVATNPKAKVSDLGVGKNVFEWAITFCDSTSTSRVTIERIVLPLAPQVSNPDPICAGEAIPTLKATGSNLIWYDDAALSRQLSRGATYQPIVSATDTFYVTQTVDGYESKPSSVILTINAHPQPPVLQNPAPYCSGEPIAPLTAKGANIQWYADRELTQRLFSGASYQVSPQVTTRYYATQTVNGCSSEPAEITVTILPRPPAPAIVSNYRVYCQGENLEPLEAVGENLRWYADAPLQQMVGTGNTYQPNVSVSSNFYVTQTVASCEGPAAVVPVTVQPAVIAVEVSGDTLMAPEGNAFQWYYEGQPLEKATSRQYVACNTGHYHLVMKKESCPVTSEPVLVTVNVPHSVLTLAPNPSPDRVWVTLTANATGPVELRLYNTLGKLIFQTTWHKPTTMLTEELNLALLPRGLYFVEVSTQRETLLRKVIKN